MVKNLYDEKKLVRRGSTRVSRPYPFAYGFVVNTHADDGDNIDCFVLTDNRLQSGQTVECDPIALMEQVEDGQIDHNILATIHGEHRSVTQAMRSSLVDFVLHVFEHIPGKTMRVGGFGDREAALDYLRQHEELRS